MKTVRMVVMIGVMVSAGSVFAKSLQWYNGFADDKYSAQSKVGVDLQCTEDLLVSVRGSVHGGQQLDQLGEDAANFEPNTPLYQNLQYKHSGLTAGEVAAGFQSLLGKINDVSVTGGAEVLMRFRKVADTSLTSYLEVSPAALLNFSIPLGTSGAKAELFNKLQRRNFRAPYGPASSLRYQVQTRLTAPEFTSFKIAPYCYYEGYTQKLAEHLSGWGTGIILKPLNAIKIESAFTTIWYPMYLGSVVHQVELNATFIIDCGGGK